MRVTRIVVMTALSFAVAGPAMAARRAAVNRAEKIAWVLLILLMVILI